MIKTFLKLFVMTVALASLLGCGSGKFQTYTGPAITSIQIQKAARKMYLISGTKIVKTYKIHLGGRPIGPKRFEADGRTPEGNYYISHRNPNSAYHLSLGISYPNDRDRAFAAANGKEPGGDIFIHGENNRGASKGDWTAGCIAVTDKQIEEIYAMVAPGTQITIFP